MNIKRTLTSLTLTGVLAIAIAGPAQARHGADDPAGHDRGDDHGSVGEHHKRHKHHGRHHRNGNDDGPNHT
jgi:hypothetical protein